MNNIREVEKINQEELDRGIAGTSASWHSQYSESPWVYIGNIDHELTEGDVLCVMSQYGEVEDIHLVREEDTGKSRGFGFLKYEDARSCVLAVDNFVGTKVCGRPLRVDHVEKYRLPKNLLEEEQEKEAAGKKKKHRGVGHAYQDQELSNKYNIHEGQDLFAPRQPSSASDSEADQGRRKSREHKKNKRKRKHEKREKKEKRHKKSSRH